MDARHLYIHVPFCARRCVYCDFSIAVRAVVPVDAYLDALAREWDTRHADSRFALDTLYLGGGTPSRLGADGLSALMNLVRARAEIAEGAEVTLEANPEDVTVDAARRWRDAGFNRVSLGVQTFDPALLAWMHRTHDADAARRAIDDARAGGFDNVSLDLIFATPGALSRSWERDIDAALALGVPHLSVYGLTVEPRTPLGRWVSRDEVVAAPEESFEREFLAAHDRLTAAGFSHYEVSNYARAGRESRHNWAYWRRMPYGGLGPSAHEFDGRVRRWNAEAYGEWVRLASAEASTTAGEEVLDEQALMAEQTYLGLRTSEGLALTAAECEHVSPWIAAGWADVRESRLRLTASGWLRLDALAADLTHFRSRY